MSEHWSEDLANLRACGDALAWCSTQPDLKTAWDKCERADWMLWLVGKLDTSAPWSEERKPLVRCALACAAEGLKYPEKGKARDAAEACIGVTQAWCEGSASKDDVMQARRGADAAAADAADADADAAAYSAYSATAAADAAAYSAYSAADAAASSAYSDAAAYSAYSATAAADAAAYAASSAADAAAYAAYADAAADSAYSAYSAGTRARARARARPRRELADIVRCHYPTPPVLP